MGKTVTAYFAFSNDNRAAVRAELEAAAEEGAKIGVGDVAKGLGRRWSELSDEEKERWKAVAKERTARLAAAEAEAAEARGSDGEGKADAHDGGADGKSAAASRPAGLPASIVKRIMSLDEDVDRISGGALKAVCKAAELFLAQMTERSMAVAAKSKRKTLKFSDVQQSARQDKRMGEMGLQDILAFSTLFAEARGDGDGKLGDDGERVVKKARHEDPCAQSITTFFGGPAAGMAPSESPPPAAAEKVKQHTT